MSKIEITYKPQDVCSKYIKIKLDEAEDKKNSKVTKVIFMGGCPGNSLALAKVLEGSTVEEIISKIKGVRCGARYTSCPDQLAKALEDYMNL